MPHIGFFLIALLYFNVVDIRCRPAGCSYLLDGRGIMRFIPSFAGAILWFVLELFYWTISIFFL